MAVGSDDSGSSDLTSYYCLNCDTKHGLGSDDTPFVYGAKYSSNEESIDSITKATTWKAAHHQIYAIINPATGGELSGGECTPCVNRGGCRNVEASASIDDIAYTITEKEWEIARNAIANNTRILAGASAETLNAYHGILEKNRVR
jgi:hypothetical protein